MIKWSSIGETFRSIPGLNNSGKLDTQTKGDIPFIEAQHINSKEPDLTKIWRRVAKGSIERSDLTLLPAGTVIVSLAGGTMGQCTITRSETVIGDLCLALPPAEDQNSELLYYYLQYSAAYLKTKSEGFGLNRTIPPAAVLSLKYRVFKLEMQQALASVLESADRIINKRKNALELVTKLKAATFFEAFGNPFSNLPAHETVRLSELALIRTDGDGIPSKERSPGSADLIIISTSHPADGRVSLVKPQTTYLSKEGILSVAAKDPAYTAFLYSFLELYFSQLKRNAVAQRTHLTITADFLEKIRVPIKNTESVLNFSSVAQHVTFIQEQSQAFLEQSEKLIQSLLHSAFTGDLADQLSFKTWIAQGLPTTEAIKRPPPIKLRNPLVKQSTELYRALSERTDHYRGRKEGSMPAELANFALRLNSSVIKLSEVDTEEQVNKLLTEAGLPDTKHIEALEQLIDWFVSYDNYHHVAGRWQMDVVRETYSNLNDCYFDLLQLLKENSFLNFSAETKMLGKLMLSAIEESKAVVDKEYDTEISKYSGTDPLSVFAQDNDFDEPVVDDYSLTMLQVFQQNSLKNFSISTVLDAVIAELPFRGLEDREGEVTYDSVQTAIERMLDKFILTQLLDQPFTFQQLQEALDSINFLPDFDTLNDYVFNHLEQKEPVLKQFFFDDKGKEVNVAAYQYLLDSMNPEIVGGNALTIPRRMFLLYSLPLITDAHATQTI